MGQMTWFRFYRSYVDMSNIAVMSLIGNTLGIYVF